jgi:hypothetical protein
MKTIYKTTLSIFLFSVLMVFGAKTAMGASCVHFLGGYEFNTAYVGSVQELNNLPCDQTPIHFTGTTSQVCFKPNPGFKIASHSPYPDSEGEICLLKRSYPTGQMTVNWGGDGKTHQLSYEYIVDGMTPAELEQINVDVNSIGQASPASCQGGNLYYTGCTVNPHYRTLIDIETGEETIPEGGAYKVLSCPGKSGYICPGYGQKITSYEQFPGDPEEEIKVVYERILPPVTADIVGIDLDDPQRIEQRNDMIVPSAQGGVPNVQIYWYSTNATNCTCTKSTGGGCGTGASEYSGLPVLATGEPGKGEGNYALTETTTFKVTCNP